MSDERSRGRTRRFLGPLACGFRHCFGSRVSPPPPPLFQPRPLSPRPSSRPDINRLDIVSSTGPSSLTQIPQPEYLHVQQPICPQPSPRISPSTSFHESTYQYSGPLVDHRVNHPAPFPLPYPQNQALLHDQFTIGALEPGPVSSQVPTGQDLTARGMFGQPSNFTITGGEFNDYSNSDNFMEKLLKETILGAQFDSSDRHPPPRCHPGTRITIIKRCRYFIINCHGKRKLRWVVGAAGVGKSAIMQSIAEDTPSQVTLGASVFFAINGRNDGTKTITTIAYQLAVTCKPYRRFIQGEVNDDPALLTKSITFQFKKLIVQPFIHQHLLDPSRRFLILIDGLDECKGHATQQELLRLIADFCRQYPTSPLIWIVASRPEHHITCIFDEDNVKSTCEKEEILVDTEEARQDAERFLRDQLYGVKQRTKSLRHLERWPLEYDFLQIAQASGGLMVYASTVVKYIGDSQYGDPSSQLHDVLKLINANLDSQTRNAMAQLDALYLQILSSRPGGISGNTRKLLLMLAGGFDECFTLECNLLAIRMDGAYSATHHLPSVIDVPDPEDAHNHNLRSFHKSFVDYLSDYARSKFSCDIQREYQELVAEYTFRILEEASDGVDFDGDYDLAEEGTLARSPGTGSTISLSWSASSLDDSRTRHRLYTKAVSNVVRGFKNKEIPFQSMKSIEVLTSRFETYGAYFPYLALSDFVFGAHCQEFVEHGILKQVPLNELYVSNMNYYVLKLRLRSPAMIAKKLSDTWNSSCRHRRVGKWEEDQDRDWTTQFSERAEESWDTCVSCCRQFEHRLRNWKAHSPDHLITFLPSSTKTTWVEVRFVDPEDDVSEWTYWFLLFTPLCELERTTPSSPTLIHQTDYPRVHLAISYQPAPEISSPTLSLEGSTLQHLGADQQPLDTSFSSLPPPQGQYIPQHAPILTSRGIFSPLDNLITMGVECNDSSHFMEQLREQTIPTSPLDPHKHLSPAIHPQTRLAAIGRCRYFIINYNGKKKLRWVVGRAGAGKTYLMMTIALEALHPGATIFFSTNGRQDGTKAITTFAYQLAVKLNPYRLFVQREVTHDPSLLRKSLSTQFKKFIVEPFIHQRILDPPFRLLITIDGLDECADPLTQQELLGLISDFCITYPSSPLVWMIASRPEPHITSFFSQPKVALSYEKEEILVDPDDVRKEVKHYLRDAFGEVQRASITLRQLTHWPSEDDFFKVAEASGGRFAYASTVVRYISDPSYGDPVSQLDNVLNIIDAGTNSNVSGEDNPMARLDALYAHIIPTEVMANTRKLLLLYAGVDSSAYDSFSVKCNMLGMTENTAYGATHHIRAVAIVPGPDEAANKGLEFYHQSFPDYLRDFKRSGFSPNIDSEAEELMDQCGLRVIEEAPDGVYMDGASGSDLATLGGVLKNGPGTGDNISVSWPAVGELNNRKLRFHMFRNAIWLLLEGLSGREEAFQSLLCVRVLTTCFASLDHKFPFDALPDSVFDESRRRELLNHGILKQIPLETLDFDKTLIDRFIRMRFKSPKVGHSNPWNTSCKHKREGSWESRSQDWSTVFVSPFRYTPTCDYCFQRFIQQSRTQLPGRLVTVCNLTPIDCMVELRFVDPDDGVSEWIYHFSIKKGGEEEAR